jgi:hypothetical protein
MSIDDYVTVNEGKDSVTITANIDLEQVKKAGKGIHYVSTSLVRDAYRASTSTSVVEELLGKKYNTHETKSEPGKFVAQKGQIKYNSFWDGILRPAEKTDYEIVVDETNGTVTMSFKNEGHGDYAKRAAKDALGVLGNYHFYFESGEKKEAPKKEEKKAEDLEKKVEGAPKGIPAEDSPEVEQFYQQAKSNYDKAKEIHDRWNSAQIPDRKAFYEKVFKPQYAEAMKAKAEAETAAEEEEEKKKAAAKQPEDKKTGDVKKN